MPPQLLFVYGTLHPDRAPAEIATDVRRFVFVGKGTICGELHDLGDYPAVRIDATIQTLVPGTVFALPEDPALLTRLDRYEGFSPTDPDGSLYLRQLLPVTMTDGGCTLCWVYIYNQPLP